MPGTALVLSVLTNEAVTKAIAPPSPGFDLEEAGGEV